MGVFGALNSAVSGLRAQASALENISGNIANTQTIGFKRLDSSFSELVAGNQATQSQQTSGSVSFSSRATNEIQGDLQAAEVDTFVAIQGDGYFVVAEPSATIDGQTTFTGQDLFTRAGDFTRTQDGFLQNNAGLVLQGFNVDSQGNTGSLLSPIQLDETVQFPAEATSEISLRGNFPVSPSTEASATGSDLLSPALRTGAVGVDSITGANLSNFLETSVAGPSVEVFNALGASFDVQTRFAKTESAGPGTVDTYNIYFQTNSNAGPTEAAFTRVPQQYVFGADGALNPPVLNVDIPNLNINGADIGDVQLRHGENGLTQFDSGGFPAVTAVPNGASAGTFQDVVINDGGRVTVTFSNGQTQDIAQIALASFNADSGLRRVDGGGTFAATASSGDPILQATGSILGSQLESSNTDIADEFTKLIITQQAYTANSRVITAGDELLTAVINII